MAEETDEELRRRVEEDFARRREQAQARRNELRQENEQARSEARDERERELEEAQRRAIEAQLRAESAEARAAQADLRNAELQNQNLRRQARDAQHEPPAENTRSPIRDAARNVANRARDAAANRVRETASNVKQKAGDAGFSVFSIAVDLADGVPFLGDIIVGGTNALQFLQALFSGHIGTAFMIGTVSLLDGLIGFLLDGLGIPWLMDLLLPSTTINAMLLAHARAAQEAREAGRSPPQASFFEDQNGDPTVLAVFFFLTALALPVYALWEGNLFYAMVGLILLALFLVVKNFREEFFSPYGGIFILTLGIHYLFHVNVASASGFVVSTQSLVLNVAIYLTITVVYLVLVADRRDVKAAIIASVFSLVVYALPSLVIDNVGNQTVQNLTVFFVMIIPIWPLFMLTRMQQRFPNGYSARVLRAYTFLFVILLLVFAIDALFTIAVTLPQFSAPGVDYRDRLGGAGELIKDKVVGIFTGAYQFYNRTQNPYAYYTGQVEDNKNIPLGIEIVDFRAADTMVPNESEVILYGNVRARSIENSPFFRESVLIVPSCLVDRKDGVAGTADPPSMNIIWGTFGQFKCTFPPLGRRGSYTIKGAATFPFQTWAYIDYTFVSEERAANAALRGVDLINELGIRENPLSKYTSGPVLLGMGGTYQPVVFRPDKDPIIPRGVRIGMTLDSNWRGGKINKVTKLEMKVPKPFVLENCDRRGSDPVPDMNDENYMSYAFENPGEDVVLTFTSVTCDLVLQDAQYAHDLSLLDKATRSFVALAEYEYTIDESTTVQVR